VKTEHFHPLQVVWFKRDLRLSDHAPLSAAVMHGPVVLIYVVENDYWQLPDVSARQFEFTRECVLELRDEITSRGGRLIIKVGAVTDVLDDLKKSHPIINLWSHEETGNGWTFTRDKQVAAWCAENNVTWHELPQMGVKRGLRDRNQWAARHGQFMAQAVLPSPASLHASDFQSDDFPTVAEFQMKPDACPSRQSGGRQHALRMLDSFYAGRGRKYTYEMSSPLTAENSCSRLSPYLALGAVSIREVLQNAFTQRQQLAAEPPEARAIELRSVDSFIARLHWHCHFIQKLESEPEIEWRSMHKAYNAARVLTPENDATLRAFAEGRTGFPFIDACMRYLAATGWINFRMRAMLVAFATYHLQLDWQAVGHVMARLFTDYEPGIHWSQVQMQSGQTGINTPRIYNPVKQSMDQDCDGVFIRRWVPEVSALPTAFLHEPWTMTEADQQMHRFKMGQDYPARLVDHVEAMRQARERFTAVRHALGFKVHADHVFQRHGSRKGKRNSPAKKSAAKLDKPAVEAKAQLSFDL
jgi:deoxyribodipyrimidine photo-lyase